MLMSSLFSLGNILAVFFQNLLYMFIYHLSSHYSSILFRQHRNANVLMHSVVKVVVSDGEILLHCVIRISISCCLSFVLMKNTEFIF